MQGLEKVCCPMVSGKVLLKYIKNIKGIDKLIYHEKKREERLLGNAQKLSKHKTLKLIEVQGEVPFPDFNTNIEKMLETELSVFLYPRIF